MLAFNSKSASDNGLRIVCLTNMKPSKHSIPFRKAVTSNSGQPVNEAKWLELIVLYALFVKAPPILWHRSGSTAKPATISPLQRGK